MRKAIAMLSTMAVLSAVALGDVVTERWGPGKSCQHSGTATFTAPAAGGMIVKIDLSALPKDVKVIRARFLPYLGGGGVPLSEPIVAAAIAAAPDGRDAPAVTGKAMELVPPRYMSLDATEIVSAWALGGLANHGLWYRGPKFDQARTVLEISYEGKLADPPGAVTGLKAFCRGGQVFLAWNEVNTPFAGKDEVQWQDLSAELKRIGRGEGEIVTYRIYRHTVPITPQTLAAAELMDEVEQHAAFDQSEIRTEWKGEQIKNVRVPEATVPRAYVESGKMLGVWQNAWAATCTKDGQFHYAVVATIDGKENTVALNDGNTAAVAEKVAPPEPIFVEDRKAQYQKRILQCYYWWLDAPLWMTPRYIHFSVSPPEKPGEAPHPMAIYNWWWGSGWGISTQYPLADGVGLTIDNNCMQTRGMHDGYGTYKAWSQGKVRNYFVPQLKRLLPWLKAKYQIDEDRIYAQSSGWAWHYPELFAATFECTTMNPKRSPAGGECERYWGKANDPAPTEWGVSAWEYWNAGAWIAAHPEVTLAPMTYAPRMHTGDFGRLDKPPLYRALLDTEAVWATIFGEGGLEGHHDVGWMYQLRRTDSAPAFANCTLDDNPGIGLGWDPGGQMNAWLCAEPRTQVDSPDKWEMTVYLTSGQRGRGGAPLDQCTADVTPRRCQKFIAKPGQKFTWTNKSVAEDKVIQTGSAVADTRGLVTLRQVIVSKGKNRLAIDRK